MSMKQLVNGRWLDTESVSIQELAAKKKAAKLMNNSTGQPALSESRPDEGEIPLYESEALLMDHKDIPVVDVIGGLSEEYMFAKRQEASQLISEELWNALQKARKLMLEGKDVEKIFQTLIRKF
jgi:hypothetical protein